MDLDLGMKLEGAVLSSSFMFALMMAVGPVAGSDFDLPFSGAGDEVFLREASIGARKPIGVGITGAERVTLTDGVRTHRAVWKTVDVIRHGLNRGRRGGYQLIVRDSYQYEVAA